MNPNVTKEYVFKQPIETMSELMLNFWYIYDLKTRVKKFEEIVREWKIDGVLLHENLSCRPNSCGLYDLKRHLMEDYDIPSLVITTDQNDSRKFNLVQVTNQIESFIELLKARKRNNHFFLRIKNMGIILNEEIKL